MRGVELLLVLGVVVLLLPRVLVVLLQVLLVVVVRCRCRRLGELPLLSLLVVVG